MSFIEHLAHDNWPDSFRLFFEGTLSALEEDPGMYLGSAMDDLRASLTRGGVARLRSMLKTQMKDLRYPDEKQVAVLEHLRQMTSDNRTRLLLLAERGIIPRLSALGDMPATIDLGEMTCRLLAGERPFEEWMYGQGYTEREIQDIYQQVDRCLFEQGVIEPANPTIH